MNSNFVRVTNVDMDGYNGRERHPHRSDVGLIVRVVEMSVMLINHEGPAVCEEVVESPLQPTVEPKMLPVLFDNDEDLETLLTCVTPDGRVLDFMDFEVEPVSKEFARYALGKASDPRD